MLLESSKSQGTRTLSYNQWLAAWLDCLTPLSSPCKIPPEAYCMQTPLIKEVWHYHLQNHHQQDLVQYFLTSISNGFQIGFHGTGLQSAKKNLVSVANHPEVVEDYLKHELSLGRMSGPYPISLCPEVHINRFGVIPKSHQPGKWRLITDLSYPQGQSVNDGISSHLCSLTYVTIDDAIANIVLLGRGSMLAKIDIKSAFRLLPVHPTDRHLLAVKWRESIYIDHCVPFGLRSAPKLFTILADLLAWIEQNLGISYLIHYLDDYLTMGPPQSSLCQRNLEIFTRLCKDLGVPLALEKLEGPSTSLSFLGLILDTDRMEIRLPEDKLHRIKRCSKPG